jgi:hypothetical protein
MVDRNRGTEWGCVAYDQGFRRISARVRTGAVTWAGSATGSIAIGALGISDALSITIPKGAAFAVRTHRTSTSGLLYSKAGNASGQGETDYTGSGDYYEAVASGLVDFTQPSADPGVGTASSGGGMYWPTVILGMTRNPTVAIWGDSIGFGSYDVAGADRDIGLAAGL